MSLLRRATRADIGQATDDRTVTVACSTQTLGRDDIVVMSEGIDLTAYRNNPVVLWQHNPDWPIARATEIGVIDGNLVATSFRQRGSANTLIPSMASSRPAS